MSATQVIQIAERLPLPERLEVISALYVSIRRELVPQPSTSVENEPFELITFDLGQEVYADRDEIYAERR